MRRSAKFILLWVLLGGGLSSAWAADAKKTAVKELTWADFRSFNYKTKHVPPALEALVGKAIKIAGFVVPVEAQAKATEFLFVPDQLACIHVPPPPPNLMIRATSLEAIDMMAIHGPRWLIGDLSFINKNSQYGEAGVEVSKARLEDF